MQTRLGPRPLPLHLGTALMTWASSESAWSLLKQGSPTSKPASEVPESLAALLPEIAALEAKAGPGQFEQALQREIRRRQVRLADGVLAYQRNDVHRTLVDPPAVWREGNTRLLDYGTTHRASRKRGTRAVLVVPSLINRWEVLDLTAEKSLMRAMAAQGLRPYLVDWGTPDDEERRFETIWTVDPQTVRRATLVGISLVDQRDPALAESMTASLPVVDAVPSPALLRANALFSRVVEYVSRTAERERRVS